MNNKRNIACAIVGSNNVGKHCLLNALTSQNTEKQRCDKVDWLRTTSINFNEKDYTIKLAILRKLLDDNNEAVASSLVSDESESSLAKKIGNFFAKKSMHLPDTAGEDKVNVTLVCFSVVDQLSFENVRSNWIPKLKENTPTMPFIIVGLQTDLRSDKKILKQLKQRGLTPITTADAAAFAESIGAKKYVEGSTKSGEGIESLLLDVVKAKKFKRSGQKF